MNRPDLQPESCTEFHLEMKTPGSWGVTRAQDALLMGSGYTGLACPGSIGSEQMLLTRHDLWHCQKRIDLPDVSDTLAAARKAMDAGDWTRGNTALFDALEQRDCHGNLGYPCPLGALNLSLVSNSPFTHYRRSLWMERGEGRLSWLVQDVQHSRRMFVSRARDLVVAEQRAGAPVLAGGVGLDLYNDHKPGTEHKRQQVGDTLSIRRGADGLLYYHAQNDDGLWFGAVLAADCDTPLRFEGGRLQFGEASRLLLRCACFSRAKDPESAERAAAQRLLEAPADYEALLAEHIALHRPLFLSAGLKLSQDAPRCNEELLLRSYEDKAENQLLEKLWHFGRYLFICGAAEHSMPFPLYGLWSWEYEAQWAQNVANENVQMIYWHQPVGGLAGLMRPLLNYYSSLMEDFRTNARRLFGCRGIVVTTYTAPGCGLATVNVPVILNWIGAAGWLSRHFAAYCRSTGDRAALREQVLPFMREAALFYEDFACYEEDGSLKLYPSVSPENSPGCFYRPGEEFTALGHRMPSVINATMDFAILKDLLSGLLELSSQEEMYPEDRPRWQKLLAAVPDYRINEDGAICEWMYPGLTDHYAHRHLSHLYPVFPGDEVTAQTRPELMPAFKKAVELRELGAQCNWSLVHMACIYSRFGEGERAAECLDLLCRSCLTGSLQTLSNDWRSMGLTLTEPCPPVLQMDAQMGVVNALQEMLFCAGRGLVSLLPACPQRFAKGGIRDFCGCGAKFSFRWDLEKGELEGSVTAVRDTRFTLLPPPALPLLCTADAAAEGGAELSLQAGETQKFRCTKRAAQG